MSLGELPAVLFSPAKIVYVGFLILAGLDQVNPPWWLYGIVSIAFLCVEIFHNDYWRIVLNGRATEKVERFQKKE